jgi:probable F420-dependent oxidoreductase
VFLAAVGELMTEVVGEVCDGLLCHAFTTEAYLREVTIPALERGAAKSGRKLDDIEISGPAFVVTGTTEEEMAAAAVGVRKQIAFYGSTPAYRGVLERHGWGELQTELNGLSKQGQWDQMGTLIDDDILDTFAIVAEPEQIAPRMKERYGDVVDRISFYLPYRSDPDRWSQVMADLKAA